jgi:hypothetical protein
LCSSCNGWRGGKLLCWKCVGVNKDIPSTSLVHMLSTPTHMPSSSVSNVESVRVQALNMLDVNASQPTTI